MYRKENTMKTNYDINVIVETTDVNYVLPVDTKVSSLVARGVIPNNENLFYGEDVPPMSNLSIMDLKKMVDSQKQSVEQLQNLVDSYENTEPVPAEPVPASVEPLKSE